MPKSNSAKRVIELRHHADLVPVEPGDVPVTVSVGPGGEAIVLWSDPRGRDTLQGRTTRPGGASFPDPTTHAGVAVRVATYTPQVAAAVGIDDLRLAHCHVQPLPGGRFLLVAARCRWQRDRVDHNALIVAPDGTVTRRGTLGDGIAHVLTTTAGKIWVGYFDEGIFGSNGWGNPGPEPIGAAGIIRFAADLQPEWRYPATGGPEPIDDCYALNVADETAWSTYYSDFPVVRIAADIVRSWPGSRTAANALIADGTRCAFIGGYSQHRDRLLAGDLDRGHFKPYRLALPGGRPLPANAHFIGRGPHLHVFAGTVWYRLDLDDVR
jgi:hypothetical protein